MTGGIRTWEYLLGGFLLAGLGLALLARLAVNYQAPTSSVAAALLLVEVWLSATAFTVGGYWVCRFDQLRRGEPLHGPRTR